MVKNVNSLADIPLVLASGSPRRIKILREMGLDPYIIKPNCSEALHMPLSPAQTVMALALRKSLAAEELLKPCEPFEDYLMLTCDTVVFFEGRILGKPESYAKAYAMLTAMNGKMNSVYSGVCLKRRLSGKRILFFDRSDVYFANYGIQQVVEYIATKEPFDAAGGYAVQGGWSAYCERIDGSLSNVIGLPKEKTEKLLMKGVL